ncbi:MAG: ribosome recycling factor [Candidatus Andersenbacteria bacterium]|nr:ribosome recycling factor [Candidatus Andersenbacteria bacterium]
MSLSQATKHFEEGKATAFDWFGKEISGLRSGRVKPDMISDLAVEHYGVRQPLQGLASVSSLDARTLLITPWDKTAVPAIEKALTLANVGAMPTVDGQMIRLSFPSLTSEVREHTIKQLNKKAEETRIRLRVTRDEALKGVKKEKEDGKLSEDDFYNTKEALDGLITEANDELLVVLKKKEAEITTL